MLRCVAVGKKRRWLSGTAGESVVSCGTLAKREDEGVVEVNSRSGR